MPYNKVDEVSAYHYICYDMGRNKGECDREMIKSYLMVKCLNGDQLQDS